MISYADTMRGSRGSRLRTLFVVKSLRPLGTMHPWASQAMSLCLREVPRWSGLLPAYNITVKFEYGFTAIHACPIKAAAPCLKQLNVCNLMDNGQRILLFTIAAPRRANGIVRGISGSSQALVFAPGQHMIAVTAVTNLGMPSKPPECEIMVNITLQPQESRLGFIVREPSWFHIGRLLPLRRFVVGLKPSAHRFCIRKSLLSSQAAIRPHLPNMLSSQRSAFHKRVNSSLDPRLSGNPFKSNCLAVIIWHNNCPSKLVSRAAFEAVWAHHEPSRSSNANREVILAMRRVS
jgi:hypothetical protein